MAHMAMAPTIGGTPAPKNAPVYVENCNSFVLQWNASSKVHSETHSEDFDFIDLNSFLYRQERKKQKGTDDSN